LALYEETFSRLLPPNAIRPPEPSAEAVARAVGELGCRGLAAARGLDPLTAQPRYFRRDDGGGWRLDPVM